ncbi:DBH-like monooxygenase protein 1 [Octopus bimaculoides]|uniref:DOMON domain-containing protein n=1 Tax=Octopus bimaculoides TaxID=37653 RepID=A0A0L8I800_OCTBM|nr:DBH-like monooxygenase protein 1 [Octopus bimaculoides]|eukprot:XP_014787916.1 PREDICTED: DBH-like monooxygenase protein 1 [Octopus bimaculoides]
MYFLAFVLSCFGSSVLADDYFHSLYMDLNKTYQLSWKFNKSHIEFHTEVKTLGYVALGLSMDGSLKNADVFFAGVSNGQSYSSNYYGNSDEKLSLQPISEWHLMYFNESDMKTTLTFCRELSGPNMKINITQNTMRVLWGYNNTDNVSDSFQQDGVKSLYLLQDQLPDPVMPNDTFTIQFRMNETRIPKSKTTYWCKSFDAPPLDEQVHAIVFSPYIQDGNEAFVHHMLLYGCYRNTSKGKHIGYETKCYSPNMPIDWYYCNEIVFGWAVGGSKFVLPEHTGMSFGSKDDPAYYLLEMHYDNQQKMEGALDSSGIEITLTRSKRQYEVGMLSVGYTVYNFKQLIPPYAKEFKYYGHCEACGSMIKPEKNIQWNEDGVKMIAILLHAHLAARKIRLHHYRDGKKLPDIMYDDNYDFNYQELRFIKTETTLLKDDILQIECVYDTTERTNFTNGGLGTDEEMCQAFIMHYPRIELKLCTSSLKFDRKLIGTDLLQYKNNQDAIKKMELIVNGLEPQVGFIQLCLNRTNLISYTNRTFPVIKFDDPSIPQPTTTEKNSAAKFFVKTGMISILISYWLI